MRRASTGSDTSRHAGQRQSHPCRSDPAENGRARIRTVGPAMTWPRCVSVSNSWHAAFRVASVAAPLMHVHGAAATANGSDGLSPMRKPSTRRMPSRVCSGNASPGCFHAAFSNRCSRRTTSSTRLPRLPRYRRIASNNRFQNAPSHSDGEMPRSRQIAAIVRPTGLPRTSASMASMLGRASSESSSLPAMRRASRASALLTAACAEAAWTAASRSGVSTSDGTNAAICSVSAAPSAGGTLCAVSGLERHGRARKQQQYALQRERPHQAALEVRPDGVEPDRAEVTRDRGEAARESALFEVLHEVAAVGGEDGNDGEDFRDARGRGSAGPILWGSGGRRKAGGVWCSRHGLCH